MLAQLIEHLVLEDADDLGLQLRGAVAMLRAPQHRKHGFRHRILGPCLVAQLQMRQAQQGRAPRRDAAAQLLWIDTGLQRGVHGACAANGQTICMGCKESGASRDQGSAAHSFTKRHAEPQRSPSRFQPTQLSSLQLRTSSMNKHQFLSIAAASMIAAGALTAAPAHAATLEKCFGIATAHHNDCAGISGLHSCKGTTPANYNPGDFRVVPTGTCEKMGGLDMAQAKAILKNPAEVKAFEAKMEEKAKG
ncbi:MAG: BufA1 family periplasmic bufferin-type metallophore [Metallibacterium sp.]